MNSAATFAAAAVVGARSSSVPAARSAPDGGQISSRGSSRMGQQQQGQQQNGASTMPCSHEAIVRKEKVGHLRNLQALWAAFRLPPHGVATEPIHPSTARSPNHQA